ncbi:MAG: aldo/keto reductase [Egibacteraceae bacterium]
MNEHIPMTITPDGRARVLNNGVQIPLLGLGVWEMRAGRECEDAVRWALEAGYRHIDTAQIYRNEESVGIGLRSSGVPRDEVFVTTKFFPESRDPVREAEASLRRLGLEQVDLYLVHWPQGGPTRAWAGMEQALERGLTRAIGVSNFGAEDLTAVLAVASVPPVVNQVLFNPFRFRRRLLEACERHQIALEAYSPLTRGRNLGDETIGKLAARHGRTPAQILLRWCLERNAAVIPKSRHGERIIENAQIFDFSLDPEDIAALDALDQTGGSSGATE